MKRRIIATWYIARSFSTVTHSHHLLQFELISASHNSPPRNSTHHDITPSIFQFCHSRVPLLFSRFLTNIFSLFRRSRTISRSGGCELFSLQLPMLRKVSKLSTHLLGGHAVTGCISIFNLDRFISRWLYLQMTLSLIYWKLLVHDERRWWRWLLMIFVLKKIDTFSEVNI